MERNFFTFAWNRDTEYAFLFWCLLWYDDKSEPKLSCMAKDLLAFMGEDKLPDNQRIDFCRWDDIGIGIIVNLRGLNRVLIIDDKAGSIPYKDKLEDYRERLLRHKRLLKIDESATIRTVLFRTYNGIDCYHDVMGDYEISKESYLTILEKYKNINRSLVLHPVSNDTLQR